MVGRGRGGGEAEGFILPCLPNLEVLDLSKNRLISFSVSSSSSSSSSSSPSSSSSSSSFNLRELNLSHNRLSSLKGWLQKLPELVKLNLANNNLRGDSEEEEEGGLFERWEGEGRGKGKGGKGRGKGKEVVWEKLKFLFLENNKVCILIFYLIIICIFVCHFN